MKHFSTNQLWVPEAMKSFGIEVPVAPRAFNASDTLTHAGGFRSYEKASTERGATLLKRGWSIRDHETLLGKPVRTQGPVGGAV